MTDYVAIVLNGLFTGIGVILAHEVWDVYKKYRERITREIKDTITKPEPNGTCKKTQS